MVFNSLEFGVFFVVVSIAYFALAYRMRWLLLLGASYFFYMWWRIDYAALLLISTLTDYFAAIRIAEARSPKTRTALLVTSLTLNLGLLFFFKYYNFFSGSVNGLAAYCGSSFILPASDFLLPVGISFYTFQSLSYTIDVYRGAIPPERHFGYFALYVSFFPQLVAGPIERSENLLPQLRKNYGFDYDRVTGGLVLMAWGLFKKIVIADQLSPLVDFVYSNPQGFAGPALVLATVAFSFQIYCDFSGYSDIALGAAAILGIRMMENFRRPYHARSVREFWQRWHISLSTWFRDYVYYPLGGSRVARIRCYANILAVFLISGLWHGANWTFVAWGLLLAILFIVEDTTAPFRAVIARFVGLTALPGLHAAIQIAITFMLISVTWVFFRAASIGDAMSILTRLHVGWGDWRAWFAEVAAHCPEHCFVIAPLSIALMEAVHLWQANSGAMAKLQTAPILRWSLCSALGWWIFLFGAFGKTQFIYFTF